jgi:hypothetical protein
MVEQTATIISNRVTNMSFLSETHQPKLKVYELFETGDCQARNPITPFIHNPADRENEPMVNKSLENRIVLKEFRDQSRPQLRYHAFQHFAFAILFQGIYSCRLPIMRKSTMSSSPPVTSPPPKRFSKKYLIRRSPITAQNTRRFPMKVSMVDSFNPI